MKHWVVEKTDIHLNLALNIHVASNTVGHSKDATRDRMLKCKHVDVVLNKEKNKIAVTLQDIYDMNATSVYSRLTEVCGSFCKPKNDDYEVMQGMRENNESSDDYLIYVQDRHSKWALEAKFGHSDANCSRVEDRKNADVKVDKKNKKSHFKAQFAGGNENYLIVANDDVVKVYDLMRKCKLYEVNVIGKLLWIRRPLFSFDEYVYDRCFKQDKEKAVLSMLGCDSLKNGPSVYFLKVPEIIKDVLIGVSHKGEIMDFSDNIGSAGNSNRDKIQFSVASLEPTKKASSLVNTFMITTFVKNYTAGEETNDENVAQTMNAVASTSISICGTVRSVNFNMDGSMVAICCADGNIYIYRLVSHLYSRPKGRNKIEVQEEKKNIDNIKNKSEWQMHKVLGNYHAPTQLLSAEFVDDEEGNLLVTCVEEDKMVKIELWNAISGLFLFPVLANLSALGMLADGIILQDSTKVWLIHDI